jgi:hypothetical protein
LSWAWITQTVEIDNAVEAAGREHVGRLFRISLPMWANGLRFVGDSGITIGDLRRVAGAGCNVPGLERWRWITVGDDGERRAGYGTQKGLTAETVLRPTRAGTYARKLWPRMIDAVEQRRRERFGAGTVDSLRARLGPRSRAMPWSPPEVHPSDGFFTRVTDGGVTDGAVTDTDADDDRVTPLVALLGRTLTALTVEQERDATASLPLAANVLAAVGPDVIPTRELPGRTGLSKEGIAMAVGYLERHQFATPQPGRAVRLTRRGLDALDAFRDRADGEVDGDGVRGALDDLLGRRDALAAAFVPPAGCWRGEKPYLTQTRRLIDDPLGALPRHPMVLHRGGWPDAH